MAIWLRFWLKDQSRNTESSGYLEQARNESATDVEEILAGEALKLMFNDPLHDARTPDVLLVPRLGGLYMEADTKFLAEHGGFHKQDINVALLFPGRDCSRKLSETSGSDHADRAHDSEGLGTESAGAASSATRKNPGAAELAQPTFPLPSKTNSGRDVDHEKQIVRGSWRYALRWRVGIRANDPRQPRPIATRQAKGPLKLLQSIPLPSLKAGRF